MTAARPPDPQKCSGPGVVPGAAADQERADEQQHTADTSAAQTLKDWRTVQAECLLAGFKADLIDGDDGRPMLVVSRWALTRSFSAPAEARMWLARVAGGRLT